MMLWLVRKETKIPRIMVSSTEGSYIFADSFKLVILVCLAIPSYGQTAVGIVGGDVVMNWTITNNSLNGARILSSPKGQVVFFFALGGIDPLLTGQNYTMRAIYTGNLSRSIVSFSLSKLKVDDAGRYKFSLDGNDFGGQVLVIAVSPSQPVVTEVVAAVLGSDYKLNCSALSRSEPSSHGLLMTSEWNINDVSVITSGRYTVQKTELTITGLNVKDHDSQVTCIAYEDQRAKSVESVPLGISVKFGPDNIQLSPSNPSPVIENYSIRINCSADCNPSCYFLWRRSSSVTTLSTSQSLIIDKVSRSDADTYTCYVSNDVTRRNSSMNTTIIVIYGPTPGQVTLAPSDESIEVKEHTVVSISCSANCNPVCQYVWTGPQSFQIGTRNLSLSMDRGRSGVYICTAKNEQNQENYKTATATVSVTVYFGPGDSISVGAIPPTYSVNLSQMIPDIVCSATCNPQCNFSWYRNGTLLNSMAILSIGVVQKRHSGNYTCQAVNRFLDHEHSSSKNLSIIVLYGAEIQDFSVQKGPTVNENENATFQCSVDSHPKSMITLRKESDGTVLNSSVEVLQSQYWLHSANCLDTDNYTCSASNNISQPDVKTIQFFVKCHPRHDFRTPFVNITYSKRHGNAVLRYTVISYPPPRFTWTFIGNGSESRDLPKSANQSNNGQQSELQFTKLDLGDFGSYKVIANNSINDPATAVLQLVSSGVPEIPSNVTITDVTHNSLRVQWVSGYSGGPEQTFYIVVSGNERNITSYAPDPGYQQVGSAIIKNLLPNTEYSIYMMAINFVGTSNMTIAVTKFTDKESSADTITGPPVSAVAGGIGAGCAVLLVAVVAVFLWRRYQGTKNGLDEEDLNRGLEERKRPESGLVDNPVYESSGSSSGGAGAVYSVVVKSKKKATKVENPGNVHSEVNKIPKKGKKGAGAVDNFVDKSKKKTTKVEDPNKLYAEVAKKPKNRKKGDVYENATLAMKGLAENVYENPGQLAAGPSTVYENPEASASKGQLVNKDGLLYADLMLGPPMTKAGKPVIHGLENQSEYAEIAFGKTGEPLPESDEEKKNGTKLNTDE